MLGRERDAAEAAKALDQRTEDDITRLGLPNARRCYSEVRYYLQRRKDKRRIKTLPKIDQYREDGDLVIDVGPRTEREPGGIEFESGAHLTFGITLRDDSTGAKLVGYRYRLDLPNTSGLRFIRIDLNREPHENPLEVPRSHIHPGFENVHLPFPVMSPLDVLDRIFDVIEPAFTR